MRRIATTLAILAAGCTGRDAPETRQQPSAPRDTTRLRAERGVVFAGAGGRELLVQCSRAAPDPASVSATWEPSDQEIAELEAVLDPALKAELARALGHRAGAPAADYYRQYVGLVIRGEHVVYTNGFGPLPRYWSDTAQWRLHPVRACDGGVGYFGAEYLPRTHRLRSFHFNGRK